VAATAESENHIPCPQSENGIPDHRLDYPGATNLPRLGTSVAARNQLTSGKEHHMRTKALIAGLAVAAAGLLSACTGEQSAAGNPATTTTAPASSTSDSSEAPEPSPEPEPAPEDPEDGGEAEVPSGEGCGPVDGTNGTVQVVPEDTSAGTVGCTEAINVITEYYADSPTKGQGTAYALTIDGWYCLTDSGAQGSGAVGCEKDGLAFHTQP
jgi:hypothetical protein